MVVAKRGHAAGQLQRALRDERANAAAALEAALEAALKCERVVALDVSGLLEAGLEVLQGEVEGSRAGRRGSTARWSG